MDNEKSFEEIIDVVTAALTQAGYEPMCQLLGYIQSGDLTYITRRDNARYLIGMVDRDKLKEYLLSTIK